MSAKKKVAKKAAKKATQPAAKKIARKAVKKAGQAPEAGSATPPKAGAAPRLQPLGEGWIFTPVKRSDRSAHAATSRRSGGEDHKPDMVEELMLAEGFDLLEEGEIRSGPKRRGADAAAVSHLQLGAEVQAGELTLLVVRQESGAISFRRPASYGSNGSAHRAIFDVPLADGDPESGRRGIVSKVVKVVLVKLGKAVAGKLVKHAGEWLVPILASALEKKLWEKRTLGWIRVTESSLAAAEDRMSGALPNFRSPERGLLFLHGTFSSCHGSFKDLAKSPFFTGARARYGDNIFAFNHFTFSKSPAENVKELLEALPKNGEFEFDVVTHSRGGLVVRELLEGSGVIHPNYARLKIGRVVMVASPSAGTPLAGPSHWEGKLSFWANLLEMLPDNPFTTGAAWLAEALQWFAAQVLGNCSGLVAMDPAGEFIDTINGEPGAPPEVPYYALASNYHPPREFLARLGDAAADQFFGGANDLVVPTAGAWRGSHEASGWIAGERLGCFGPGGNMASNQLVHHCNYFAIPSTVEFLLAALRGQALAYGKLDPAADLPDRRLRFTRGLIRPDGSEPPKTEVLPPADNRPLTEEQPRSTVDVRGFDTEEILWLTVIVRVESVTADKQEEVPLLLATYGSARVVVPFYILDNKKATKGNPKDKSGDEAGKKWGEIFARQRFLIAYANGLEKDFNLNGTRIDYPTTDFLKDFGDKLFHKLFPEDIRNIYDISRFKHKKRRLKIVFTSMIPWVADIPWELAYDAKSDCFLSCADVRFIRNVLTPTPANTIESKPGPLRILVVSAQPNGLGTLSIEEEKKGIKDSFRPLEDAGLVEVEVIAGATPSRLHECLRHPGNGEFDVLHFIGHGIFEEDTKTGYLFFEDEQGRARKVAASQFLDIVRGRNIRLIFLNACETGRGGRADYNRGVAMALARDGMPAVVANQYSVIDRSASLFSLHFYGCLAQGLPIGDSMREARIAIQYCGVEPMDWGVPVLFTSYPDARLCRPLSGTVGSKVPPGMEVLSRGLSSMRRNAGPARKTVTIWNAENSCTCSNELQAMADELNAAQEAFHIQIEHFTPPRNFWATDPKRPYDGVAYLRGNKVIGRMDRIRHRMGADFMFCVTKLPLEGHEMLNLYYFHEKQVAVFSTWNFTPAIEGTLLKQAIANYLGIFLLDCATNVWERGGTTPKPNDLDYYNNERSVEHLTGRMNFRPLERHLHKAVTAKKLTQEEYDAVKVITAFYQAPLDADSPASASKKKTLRTAKTQAFPRSPSKL